MRDVVFLGVTLCLLVLGLACSSDKGDGPEVENHAPVMAAIRDTTVSLGDTLHIPLIVSDEDGDELQFEVIVECDWADILRDRCPAAGVRSAVPEFWYWPRSYDPSQVPFTVIARDPAGASAGRNFRVTIVPR